MVSTISIGSAVSMRLVGVIVCGWFWPDESVPGGRAEDPSCSLPRDDARIDTVQGVFAGAAWHEREAAELLVLSSSGVSGVGCCSIRSLRELRCVRMRCLRRVLG